MAGLHLFRSNRIELLARLLSGLVRDLAPADPFAPLQVVVGSRGMEQWLRHLLAQELGVCANFAFPFPETMLDAIVAEALGPELAPEAADPWAPEALTWSLLELLPEHVEQPGFEVVRSYLDDPAAWRGPVDARQFGLARRLAEVFDRYVAFRPELARAWSLGSAAKLPPAGASLRWQPQLFRSLQARANAPHRAERMALAEQRLRTGSGPTPAPLVIFGVSSLPPGWMSLIGALASRTGVYLFLLCPSQQYWADLRTATRAPGCLLPDDREKVPEALRLLGGEAAHPLLVSMGRVARDFQLVLESQPDDYVDGGLDAFPDPANEQPPSALHWLQSDLLACRHPADAPGRSARALAAADDSVQLHSCYGPTRQVEVLRELLLGMLQDDPSLQPRHILVMTPDIESYAPLITAVFDQGPDRRLQRDGQPVRGPEGWGPEGAPKIPFEIADRSVRRLNPVADALLRVLSLADGRMEASAVIDLLTLEPVRQRFGLAPEDLPKVQSWVQRSGIRWARDAQHRQREGQPADEQNTWVFGLRRLALGVVMADEQGRMLQADGCAGEVRPFDDMEGAETLLLGKLIEYCSCLFAVTDALRDPRPLQQWGAALLQAMEQMTLPPQASSWLAVRVREGIDELTGPAAGRACSRAVSLQAICAALQGRFEIAHKLVKEQSGAVTFCAMRPMRSVPYDVICLLGMDEDAFPRKGGGYAFDLTQLQPQVGDMDPRDEDRYLLLEAILAARSKLVVLYTGRDPRNNEPKPPCVPIGELRDLLDQSFATAESAPAASARLTTEHPLQAFSPRAFAATRPTASGQLQPFSFDRRLRNAAQACRNKLTEAEPFLLEQTGAQAPGHVTLQDLIAFFKHPAEYLLRRRLKIDWSDEAESIPDREPVQLQGLQRWSLRHELRLERLAGRDPRLLAAALRAGGTLPLGYAGQVAVDDAADLVTEMLGAARLLDPAGQVLAPSAPIPIDLTLGQVRLTGSLTSVYRNLHIDLQFGSVRPKHVVGCWLTLLAWHAMDPGAGRAVLVCGNDNKLEVLGYEPPASPRAELHRLVRLYLRGLREPLALFPGASWCFSKALHGVGAEPGWFDGELPGGEENRVALELGYENALHAWSAARDCDLSDPYIARLFEGREPLTDPSNSPVPVSRPFAAHAVSLWGGMWKGRRTRSQMDWL